jgi:hypothetical protein
MAEMEKGSVGRELALFRQVAAAIGESLETVCSMPARERAELVQVLGLKVEEPEEIEDSDEELKDNHDNDNIFVSSDDEEEVTGQAQAATTGEARGEEEAENTGWGECPMCGQLLRLPELQLHCMACQGIHLNGGEGLHVNPMEVQSRCPECKCLVPDLVFDEHTETCWAKSDNRRRILTPLERRAGKGFSSAPRK